MLSLDGFSEAAKSLKAGTQAHADQEHPQADRSTHPRQIRSIHRQAGSTPPKQTRPTLPICRPGTLPTHRPTATLTHIPHHFPLTTMILCSPSFYVSVKISQVQFFQNQTPPAPMFVLTGEASLPQTSHEALTPLECSSHLSGVCLLECSHDTLECSPSHGHLVFQFQLLGSHQAFAFDGFLQSLSPLLLWLVTAPAGCHTAQGVLKHPSHRATSCSKPIHDTTNQILNSVVCPTQLLVTQANSTLTALVLPPLQLPPEHGSALAPRASSFLSFDIEDRGFGFSSLFPKCSSS